MSDFNAAFNLKDDLGVYQLNLLLSSVLNKYFYLYYKFFEVISGKIGRYLTKGSKLLRLNTYLFTKSWELRRAEKNVYYIRILFLYNMF